MWNSQTPTFAIFLTPGETVALQKIILWYFTSLLSVFCFLKTVEDSLNWSLPFVIGISQKNKNSHQLCISPTKTYTQYINVQIIIPPQVYMYPKNKPQ